MRAWHYRRHIMQVFKGSRRYDRRWPCSQKQGALEFACMHVSGSCRLGSSSAIPQQHHEVHNNLRRVHTELEMLSSIRAAIRTFDIAQRCFDRHFAYFWSWSTQTIRLQSCQFMCPRACTSNKESPALLSCIKPRNVLLESATMVCKSNSLWAG